MRALLRGSFVVPCLLIAGASLAQSFPDLSPRYTVPKPRLGLDESFIVEVPKAPQAPCIAIDFGIARLLVSRQLLDQLATLPPISGNWKTEIERLARIHGDRARELLSGARADNRECAERVDSGSGGDASYLAFALVGSGKASVVDAKGGRVTEKVRIRYVAGPVGGRISMLLDRGEEFLTKIWFLT